MSDPATDAARIAAGLQLARLDHRHGDIARIVDGLGHDAMTDVIRELLDVWADMARWSYRRADLRAAVAADAAYLAGAHDHQGEQP